MEGSSSGLGRISTTLSSKTLSNFTSLLMVSMRSTYYSYMLCILQEEVCMCVFKPTNYALKFQLKLNGNGSIKKLKTKL